MKKIMNLFLATVIAAGILIAPSVAHAKSKKKFAIVTVLLV